MPVFNNGSLAIIAGFRSHVFFDATLMSSFVVLSGDKYYRTVKVLGVEDSLWITENSG